MLSTIIDLFLHLDKHLSVILQDYGPLTYVILFAIVLCETGLVVTPFLPGDSLLFAAGAFAGKGDLDIALLIVLFLLASIVGDSMNYSIGKTIGKKAFSMNTWFLKQEHLKKTHGFYEKYGAKTIVIARFLPIVRTLAPFVAGVGTMNYGIFMKYNVIGSILWVLLFTFAGYFFGGLPFVEHNFSLVILAIILISVVPTVVEWIRHRMRGQIAE